MQVHYNAGCTFIITIANVYTPTRLYILVPFTLLIAFSSLACFLLHNTNYSSASSSRHVFTLTDRLLIIFWLIIFSISPCLFVRVFVSRTLLFSVTLADDGQLFCINLLLFRPYVTVEIFIVTFQPTKLWGHLLKTLTLQDSNLILHTVSSTN